MKDPQNITFTNHADGPCVVSIGTFDGVHRGHQYLLAKVRERATKLGLSSLVVTFEPIPVQLFNPDLFKGRLATPERKLELIGACGIDRVLVLPFTREFAKLSPEEFMEQLVKQVQPVELWVGSDFALGHGRSGNVDRLGEIGSELNLAVNAVDRIDFEEMGVSSSVIRHLIAEGHVEAAERLLGRPYEISGEVIRGSQVGRTIGYPTANVALPESLVLPADGIYVTYARIDGDTQDRPAMTYIGTRPALNTGIRLIETHLIDFDDDLYGKQLTTSFVKHLRPDSDFAGVESLVAQLQQDEADTRKALKVPQKASGTPIATLDPIETIDQKWYL